MNNCIKIVFGVEFVLSYISYNYLKCICYCMGVYYLIFYNKVSYIDLDIGVISF